MTGPAIVALVAQHGGLVRIHVVPAVCHRTGKRGWQNVLECADGFTRRLTLAEDRAYGKALGCDS